MAYLCDHNLFMERIERNLSPIMIPNRSRSVAMFFLSLFYGLLPLTGEAQGVIDSLRNALQNARADTVTVNNMIDDAWKICDFDPEQAKGILQNALTLSRKLQYPRGEASAENGLGMVAEIQGNLDNAEHHYKKALAMRTQLNLQGEMGNTLNNLGSLEVARGQLDSALVYFRRNKELQERQHDSVRIARALYNMAGIYQEMGLYDEAHKYLQEARPLLESKGNDEEVAKIYTEMGHIRFEMDLYREAKIYYGKALERYRNKESITLAEILTNYGNTLDELDSAEAALQYYDRALTIWRKFKNADGEARVLLNKGDAHKRLGQYPAALADLYAAEKVFREQDDPQLLMEAHNIIGDVHYRSGDYYKALRYVQEYYNTAQRIGDQKYIQKAYKDFAEVYAAMGDHVKAYGYQLKYDSLSRQMTNERMATIFARKEALYDEQKQREEINAKENQLKLRDAELARGRIQRNALIGGALALVLVIFLLSNRNRAVASARERADELLRNILPEATAEELKRHNAVQPVRYDSVTVMFSDFVNFTQTAEKLSPEALIANLDECFRLFDDIITRHGLEKIKTIGDAYMCAGGLPIANETHAFDAVNAALEMQSALENLMKGRSVRFQMRVGIHTGPVVAGVVGSRKFAYDIWGDTVNTAARMEQGSAAGRVNISETTYDIVKDRFTCTFRGHLPAKNKGEIAMYFVDT